ncbi:MAG TPA: hypothetical protein VHM19_04510, partial [Polyangiales bacterium]|nr:hypothetical protein [Polyangiales bacterium]
MPRHLLHGLCVEADTTLSALAAPADRAVDVRLCPWQVDRASFDAYLGELLAAPPLIDRRYTTSDDALTTRAISAEHGRLWLSVFFDRVLFALDRDSGELRRYVRREQEVPFGEVLQAGSYWAVLLALRGRVAHHASA